MRTWDEHYYGNIGQAPDVNKIISTVKSKYNKANPTKNTQNMCII